MQNNLSKNQKLKVADLYKKGIPTEFSCKVCERFIEQQGFQNILLTNYFFPKINRSRPTRCEVGNKINIKNRKKRINNSFTIR